MTGKRQKPGKAKKSFTEAEITGLLALGVIIRTARSSINKSIRGFAELINKASGQVQRYEKAGEWDKWHDNFIDVPEDYLKVIAPYTPYIYGDLASLKVGLWREAEPLSKIIASRKALIGEENYFAEGSAMRLTKAEIINAESGILHKDGVHLLAKLIGVSVQELLDGSITDLVDRFSKNTVGDSEESNPMCVEAIETFQKLLKELRLDLSKDADFEKFCEKTGIRENGSPAQRLRQVALKRGKPPNIDDLVDVHFVAQKFGETPLKKRLIELIDQCRSGAC